MKPVTISNYKHTWRVDSYSVEYDGAEYTVFKLNQTNFWFGDGRWRYLLNGGEVCSDIGNAIFNREWDLEDEAKRIKAVKIARKWL